MDETKQLEMVREIDYVIEDVVLDEPFEVYKSANAWWVQEKAGNIKVEKLILAFKQCYKVHQACILAGISRAQWEYFNQIHPKFSGVKQRCEEVANMYAKSTVIDAVKKNWVAAFKFLEVREPEMFGRRDSIPPSIPDGGTSVSALLEAFVDKDGRLISKRKTITITNGNPTSTDSA